MAPTDEPDALDIAFAWDLDAVATGDGPERRDSYPIIRLWVLYFRRLVPYAILFFCLRLACCVFLFQLILFLIVYFPDFRLPLSTTAFVLAKSLVIALVSALVVAYESFCVFFYHQIQEAIQLLKTSQNKLKRMHRAKSEIIRILCPGPPVCACRTFLCLCFFNPGHAERCRVEYRFRLGDILLVSIHDLSMRLGFGGDIYLPPALLLDELHINGFKVVISLEGWEWGDGVNRNSEDPSSFLCDVDTGDISPGYPQAGIQTLDEVPRKLLSPFIRVFQRTISPGSSAVLHFSTYEDNILSPSAAKSRRARFAALGLRPRQIFSGLEQLIKTSRDESPLSDLPPETKYTNTPLHITVGDITRLLTSGPTPLHIVSIRDISEEYAWMLDMRIDDMRLQQFRSKLPDEVMRHPNGEYSIAPILFRRLLGSDIERLFWISAAVKTKLLTRWEVVVGRE